MSVNRATESKLRNPNRNADQVSLSLAPHCTFLPLAVYKVLSGAWNSLLVPPKCGQLPWVEKFAVALPPSSVSPVLLPLLLFSYSSPVAPPAPLGGSFAKKGGKGGNQNLPRVKQIVSHKLWILYIANKWNISIQYRRPSAVVYKLILVHFQSPMLLLLLLVQLISPMNACTNWMQQGG